MNKRICNVTGIEPEPPQEPGRLYSWLGHMITALYPYRDFQETFAEVEALKVQRAALQAD